MMKLFEMCLYDGKREFWCISFGTEGAVDLMVGPVMVSVSHTVVKCFEKICDT